MTTNAIIEAAAVRLEAQGFRVTINYETEDEYASLDLNLDETRTRVVWDNDYVKARWRLTTADHVAGFYSVIDQREEPGHDVYEALCYMLTKAETEAEQTRRPDARLLKLLAEVEDRL